jgi:predicted transcriptional regulator
MNRCFCIQPFDGSVFDKRFDDIFQVAIESAGLEAYRVDRDPTVSIPIEDIEKGIKNSEICFAEITSDNPNVWFELGFALAIPKNVVMVCSDERKSKFPFDIQHRSIITYKTESTSDFDELKSKIKERILALLKKDEEIIKTKNISLIADTEGLSQHEMVALVSIMQNSFAEEDAVSTYTVKSDMNNAGFTDIAVSLSLKLLIQKGFIRSTKIQDYNGNEYFAYVMEETGVEWLMKNQEKLVLQKELEKPNKNKNEDDLPF